jgi:uncharacterized protein
MLDYQLNPRPKLHPALSVFFIILLAGLGFIIGGVVGVFAALPFFDGSEPELMDAIQNIEEHPEIKNVLFIAQVGATLGGLVLAPIIFLKTQEIPVAAFFHHNRIPAFLFLIAGLAVIVSFGLNSLLLKWNQEVVFPEFMERFESWARDRESEAARQTVLLTEMGSVRELLIAVLVIAVLPAVGEEFVFRGIIQNEVFRGTNNIHVSIWFSAIVFSAIHLQFFGFLPRMMLGAIFGYLYYWSGNLWTAIFAHFVNNATQVIALYFYQHGSFDFDLEKPESIPGNVVVISTLLTGGLLFYFYKYFQNHKPHIHSL